PGVAMGSEPTDPAAMHRPPRPPAESVLGGGLWQRIVRVGAMIAAVTLGIAVWAHATGRPWQSMAFFALCATQLAVAAGSRGRPFSARGAPRLGGAAGPPARPGTLATPSFLIAIAGAPALQFAALSLPFLRDLLHTRPLTIIDLLVVAALSTLGYAAVRLDRV